MTSEFSAPIPARLLPLFLRLEGKPALVVGAGSVAEGKIEDLVDAGAKVTVVALAANAAVTELAASGAITLVPRAFTEDDVAGAWLVIAATREAEVQRRVCAEADARRVFAIAVDDPPNGSAYSGSVIRRGPITVSISTSGEAPALARLLREVLEQALPDADWVEAARALRERWRSEGTPMASRFGELVRAFKERAAR
jgi:siroheme synthase-like protein